MDWSTVLTCLITTLLGGGVGVLGTLRSARRKADAEAAAAEEAARAEADKVWAARLDQMREEVDYERQRNIDLDAQHKKEIDYERERNKELIVRNDDKERRFGAQTDRLREVQDRELKAHETILALTKEKAALELELAHKRCEVDTCPWRQPPTAHTPPMPETERDEWHRERLEKEKEKKKGTKRVKKV